MSNLSTQVTVSKVKRESPTQYRMRWGAPDAAGQRIVGEVVYDDAKGACEFDALIGRVVPDARPIIEREARAFYKTVCEMEARIAARGE